MHEKLDPSKVPPNDTNNIFDLIEWAPIAKVTSTLDGVPVDGGLMYWNYDPDQFRVELDVKVFSK